MLIFSFLIAKRYHRIDASCTARWYSARDDCDEAEEQWAYMDHVFDAWRAAGNIPPPAYAAGSWGPDAADDLLAKDGRRWRKP